MSFGDYLVGAIGLVAIAGSLGLAAVRLRSRLLPGWSAAPARLAEAVLGVSALTVIMQLLGVVGILAWGTLVGVSVAAGVAALAWLPAGSAARSPGPPAPRVSPLQLALALIAAAFLVTHWATGLQDVWARGMVTFDSLWYHGPVAARIAEEGSIWSLHFTDPLYLNWFYPENSELQHAAGIILFGRDLISPLLNFAWLGLALLAAWCVGRPYGVAPLSLVAVAVILDTGPMVPREAGTLANDIAPIALLLATAAILLNAESQRRLANRDPAGTGAGPSPGPSPATVPNPAARVGAAEGAGAPEPSAIAPSALGAGAGGPPPRPPGSSASAPGAGTGGPPTEPENGVRASGGGPPGPALTAKEEDPEARPPTAALATPALLVAGLAAGLALGTKMTIAAAVVAVAVGVAFLAPRGLRVRAFGVFVGGVAITAGFWFLRNLVHSGSPLPWIHSIAGVDLPGPDRGLQGRDPYSVAHYIAHPTGEVWNSFFFTGVRNLLGPGWALLLAGPAVGAVLAIARPRTAAVRVLGVTAAVAAVAYLFTPLTAAGTEGTPLAFTINFRYLLASLALGLALLPLWGPVAADWVGLPFGLDRLRGDWVRLALLAGGLVLLYFTSRYSDSAYIFWGNQERAPHTYVPGAIAIAVAMVGVPVGLALLGRASARLATAAALAALAAVLALGWERQDDYIDARYADGEGYQFQIDDAVAWANPISGARIAVAGTSGAYNQYGFYGAHLDNYVQYVGRERPSGDFVAFPKCRPWQNAINRGDYDYVVTTPGLDLNEPSITQVAPERGWLVNEPNAEEILRVGRVSVFKLNGPLDPDLCGSDGRTSKPAGGAPS